MSEPECKVTEAANVPSGTETPITAEAVLTDAEYRDPSVDTPLSELEVNPRRRVRYLRKVPFVRLFANFFDYRGDSTRGEFILDFGLLTAFGLLVLILLSRIEPLLALLVTAFVYYPPLLSLLARRLNDAGHRWWFCFFSFVAVCFLAVLVLCLTKTRRYEVEYPSFAKALAIILLILILNPYSLLLGGFLLDAIVTDNGVTTHLTTDIGDYNTELANTMNAEQLMPQLDELGDYEELHFASKETLYSYMLGFCSTGISLYAEYGDSYNEMKEKALAEHDFLDLSVQDSDGNIELPAVEFEHRGFTYRVVADPEYIDFRACKSFMLVGYNDEAGMIAYHYFYDFDIDYIAAKGEDPAEEMQKLMDKSFHKFNFK